MNEILCFGLVWVCLSFKKCCDIFCYLYKKIDEYKRKCERYMVMSFIYFIYDLCLLKDNDNKFR